MSREWAQDKPWWDVHYTVNKGTYWEYESGVNIQADSSDEAMQTVQKHNPLVNVWAAYRK